MIQQEWGVIIQLCGKNGGGRLRASSYSQNAVRRGLGSRLGLLGSWKATFSVFFEASTRASSFDSTAVAVTPSGETVTTRYGIPDFGMIDGGFGLFALRHGGTLYKCC